MKHSGADRYFRFAVSRGRALRSVDVVDAKRIEIMQDGAASFHGSRGANDVILVTTKRAPR